MRKPKPSIDRLPPHSIEAEKAGVLGCQMMLPTTCIAEVQNRLCGDVTAFYDLRHQEIQRAFFELADAMKPVDVISVMENLKAKNLLEQIGGIGYLQALTHPARRTFPTTSTSCANGICCVGR